MDTPSVLVIGSGVAGLGVAIALADFNIDVTIVEKAAFAGGHAIQFSCKATTACVQCGACLVEEKLEQALAHPRITLMTGSRAERIVAETIPETNSEAGFQARITRPTTRINPCKCTACGRCKPACPQPGALVRGTSGLHRPFFAIDTERCLHVQDRDCSLCRTACPEDAIELGAPPEPQTANFDAVVLATGFEAYNPRSKPFGYGRLPNVITNLELERMLREDEGPCRPSDGNPARRIAFIQCVGSRDVQLNHLWCSRVCCGSALRLARLIRTRQTDSEITLFYIDIQTFGPDFETFLKHARQELDLVRMIPGDIFETPQQNLRVFYYDPQTQSEHETTFDLVVLSVGITPGPGTGRLARQWGLPLADTGFMAAAAETGTKTGVFCTGTVRGPMSIADSTTRAESTAAEVIRYLRPTDHTPTTPRD